MFDSIDILAYLPILIGLYMFYKVFNPLAVAIIYKIKYGEKVVIKFWPLVGTFGYVFLGEAMGDSQKWVRNLVKENPKAKIVMTNFCFQPEIFIVDAEYCKEILMHHSLKLEWTDLLFASEHFMDFGLVATNGKKWKQQRSLLGKVFHFDALKKRIPHIKDIAQEKMEELKVKADGKQVINVIQESQKMTGEVVVRTFFGKKFEKVVYMGMNVNDTITTFVQDCARVSMDPFFSLKRILLGKRFGSTVLKSKKEKAAFAKVNMLRHLAYEMVDERLKDFDTEKDDEKKDFLDHYLCALLKNNPEDNKITKEEIVQQFITLYFAGMDTTANLTGKLLYFIAQYPDIYKKIQKEIDEIIPTLDDITPQSLGKLEITQAFIKEILRYSSPAFILGFRSVMQEFSLGNEVVIPKDMVIDISFHAILRDEKNFKDPETFDIDRFLGKKEVSQAYLPFGAGPRNCIGQHLAQIEAKVFLIYYLKHYKLEFQKQKAPLKMGGILLYQPQDDGLITLTPKN